MLSARSAAKCRLPVFPGVLESLFGIKYDFTGTWGVSRAPFEAFTLGTLAVVVGLAFVGYLWRRFRDTELVGVESAVADSL